MQMIQFDILQRPSPRSDVASPLQAQELLDREARLLTMARTVPSGRSPWCRGTVVLALVTGFHQIS